MLENTAHHDGTVNNGRKGIAYDWQSLYAASAVATFTEQLSGYVPELVD